MSDSPYEARSVLKTLWWLVLLRGILAVLFGIAVLAWPKATVVVFVVLFAVFSFLDGILDIVLGVQAKGERGRWLIFLQGALAIIAGIIAVVWPSITAVVLLWLVALWAIFSGVMEIAGSLELRRLGQPRWWWHTVAGVLAIVLGAILLFGNPTQRNPRHPVGRRGARHRQRDRPHHRGRDHATWHQRAGSGDRGGRPPGHVNVAPRGVIGHGRMAV